MTSRVRTQQWLSSKEREALLAGSAILIDSLFDEYHLVDPWKPETIFLTRFGKHLPRTYFSHYTPYFFKQFGACVITMAWKFAQPQPLLPCSLAEQLAGWAILEEAREILKHDSKSEDAPTPAFQRFIARVFPDTAFRSLFDPASDGGDATYEPGSKGQTFSSVEVWLTPFPGRTQNAHPYAGGSELVGRAYQRSLTRREGRTLSTAIIVLIDEIFEAITLREKEESERFALFALDWHLPSHYQAEYTPLFQKQFIVCIFTVAWKLVQPKPIALSSVAEELAAWAIITAAKQQVESDNELAAEDEFYLEDEEEAEVLSPEIAFENFLEVFLEDEDFLLLFDGENEGIETSPVGQWLHMTSLAFKDWRKPFTDDPELLAHPYVWSP